MNSQIWSSFLWSTLYILSNAIHCIGKESCETVKAGKPCDAAAVVFGLNSQQRSLQV